MAIVLATLLSGCVAASKPCFAPEWEFSNYRAKMESRGMAWVELTDAERQRALETMNRDIHPPAGIQYERIGYFRHPGEHMVVVAYMMRNCVWVQGMAFESEIRRIVAPKEPLT